MAMAQHSCTGRLFRIFMRYLLKAGIGLHDDYSVQGAGLDISQQVALQKFR
ncbi:hypothetical protein D3C86_1665170 [compost metagenome]